MKFRTLLSGVLLVTFVLPAAAQPMGYFIVQDAKTKHCTVVHKKPVGTTETVVGPNGVVYKTRTEALGAMKTVKVCHNG
jgi:glucose dehydrogenase